jgi:hypothetical protein
MAKRGATFRQGQEMRIPVTRNRPPQSKGVSKGIPNGGEKDHTGQRMEAPKERTGSTRIPGIHKLLPPIYKGFAQMARPLHDLTMKETPWTWGSKQDEAFERLKEAVTSEPVLRHANPREQFRMETDASNFAYGAILSQKAAHRKETSRSIYVQVDDTSRKELRYW